MMTGLPGFALVAVLLAETSAPAASMPVNKGGAPGLIRAAGQFVAVDLLDGKDARVLGSLTATEVKDFGALVRAGSPGDAQTISGPWTAVFRIKTRSRGVYVAYLMNGNALRLEVPTAVARQLGVAPGLARHKLVEVQLRYERWLYAALTARLGPSDTRRELPPGNMTLDQLDGKAPTPPPKPPSRPAN
jgi:hypothetical protein